MAEESAVTVCVRVRPLLARENADLDDKGTVSWKSEDCTISQVDGTKSFTFDQVFHSMDSTEAVYKRVAAPIISSAVQGYNGTIFAYGQTASGKTYTMLGTKDCPGILPMAIDDVFMTICRIPDREFLLRISYMEIHNETIQDLLCSNIRKKKPLVVREDINRSIYVEDLSEEVVVSPEQVMNWLQKGEKNRHYGETKMNERSSRSHTIFRMIIESKEKADISSSNYEGAVMVSHLNLVDLAGSERASQTGAEGIRLKEGCNINRSLFILGQVIKKLSDDQSGGYISYRDSKLTRILQNSLGGNAKTLIICTVTPVSLEETLSTLQFASTAKKMKNSPKINEVLDDDALLKRYRKEIEDLKRRLEEVSSHSHTREVEKDQLAQLLEEKNSLQKQQEDSIRALTEMLVTASSFSQEQELKVRKKRRVTWAPGEMNQKGGICFLEELPCRAKKFKASLSSLPDMDESVWSELSEGDNPCTVASAAIPEEWIPGTEITFSQRDFADSVQLCEMLVEEKDAAVNDWQAMKEKLESMQQKNEELACELEELKERISTDEFVALEKEATKEQEMQLIHEISSLKAAIANAEVYNQDLQEEAKSKDMQLNEQEHKIDALKKQITELKNLVEELKAESGKRDMSFSLVKLSSANEMQQMKQSLSDAEAVALDAKRESSFLRSENLALKEKLNHLSDTHIQMEKDAECYRRQLEDGKITYKNMLSDMQKELQYYVKENAKLTSLLDGKVPKDLLSCVELEEKLKEVKNELTKALEENIFLRKEVTALSEVGLKPDHESLQKEILEKSEVIAALTSKRETLLSQVSEDKMLHEMIEVLKSKEDIANTEAMKQNDATLQEVTCQFEELEQKFSVVSEENQQMKGQVACLSDENIKLNATISDITQELSSKVKELQEKDQEVEKLKEQLDQTYQKLREMELNDQVKALQSKAEAVEMEKLALAQRLRDGEEQIRALTEERNGLQQEREDLERERDQIKEDIQETVSMNIEAQEELRNAHDSLKQSQKRIRELEQTVLEKELHISSVKETFKCSIDEQKEQILKLTEDLEQINLEKNLLLKREAKESMPKESNEFQLMKKEILSLKQEKTELQQQLEVLREDKDQCVERHPLLATLVQELQAKNAEENELGMKEQLCQALDKLSEMEQLREQLKASESIMEAETRDKVLLSQKLCENEETMRALVQERDELRHSRSVLRTERDEVKEEILAAQSMLSLKMQELQEKKQELHRMKEQLCKVQQKQKEMEHLEEQLKVRESELEAEKLAKLEMAQRLHSSEEERKSLTQERDDLNQQQDSLQTEREALSKQLEEATCKLKKLTEEYDQLQKNLSENTEKFSQTNAELECALAELKEQLNQAAREKSPERREQEHMKCLDGKVLNIMETLEKFFALEKRSEHLRIVSLNLKSDLNSQKAAIAKGLVDLSPEQSKNIKRLQREHELLSNTLHSLLNKLQYHFSCLCKKKGEYYANISKYTEGLLEEKRKQYELLTQIQHLKKPCLEQHGAFSEQLSIFELSQNLDFYTEQILKDVAETEEEFQSIEAKIQQMEKGSKEANQYLDRCSVRFDVQDIEAGIKQDNERLWPLGHLLKPKAQVFYDDRRELETRNNNYCEETEATLKTCRERTKELLQELKTLKEQQTPCGIANHALEEENYNLGNKLKAAEQYIKDLKLKIQELENAANEAGVHLQEKERRIATLEMEIQIRASKSEVVRLKALLEEKETCLRSALMEKQTLQTQLDKGAELYKEEIEDLKTQLAKAEMARTKQSKYFDREMANARAVAEYKEDRLRQLREELRRAQQEQDVTVISSAKDLHQPSLPITCGGGSGIVQSTQVLVLKSEHAKLEKEYGQLQKQYELVLKNEVILKEEVKKWKERALKRREQLAKDSDEEHRLKSPRKTAPPSFTEVPPSPSKRCSLKPLEVPLLLPLNYPTSFFDNSRLGTLTADTKLAGAESTENGDDQWFETSKKDEVAKCKTQ
ncbi:centromere-associated protein E [Tiliqua scincoides]|uniref:centromere-associated protein E n=1 Tax=Tiliqua scincoides TaxID=71010 RepID=UPI003463494F